jgi:hypothetical protein
MTAPLTALGMTLLVFAIVAACMAFGFVLVRVEEAAGVGASVALFVAVFGVFMFGLFWVTA